MHKRAVLFDAGGTLIHMDRRFFVEILNAHGVVADVAAFKRAEAVARVEVTRILRSDQPGTDGSRWVAYAGALMRELRCQGETLDRVRATLRPHFESGAIWTRVEDGTVETLELLRAAEVPMAVVSNADGRVAGFLEKAGLARYFDVIVDSGIFGIEKPDPRIFLHACAAIDADPSGATYVGDVYEIDAVGARAVGMTPVIISDAPAADWQCAVIASLTELPPLLGVQPRLTAR